MSEAEILFEQVLRVAYGEFYCHICKKMLPMTEHNTHMREHAKKQK